MDTNIFEQVLKSMDIANRGLSGEFEGATNGNSRIQPVPRIPATGVGAVGSYGFNTSPG